VYQWVDHTAELELEIDARSEEDVLADAMAALGELLGGGSAPPAVERRIAVTASDRPALLAAWLEELIFLAENDGFTASVVDWMELREDALEAVVVGELDDPPPLVKAVTYHRLMFEPGGAGYVARVVLDV
jgi:SHS2 domain-containing protein